MWLPLDRSLPIPLITQVYGYFRTNILKGTFPTGERLPSTRELSQSLHVSRNVIIEAYEQLMAEGFIVSRRGSGAYVAEGIDLNDHSSYDPPISPPSADMAGTPPCIDFRTGIPALDHIPRSKMAKLLHRICLDTPVSTFAGTAPEGCPELRQALSRYLFRSRGVRCVPDQILVTTGAIQAITIVAQALVAPADQVVIEDPSSSEIRKIFLVAGARLLSVPVDDMGIDIKQIPFTARPRLIFLTPAHQSPLGGILPIQRRLRLLDLAARACGYVVEDDYDSELRFRGNPIQSLQGIDPDRVIYIGTFSKILSPALRIGYLVLPTNLVNTCRDIKLLLDRHTPVLEQLMLAGFINEGYLESHTAKMKRLYERRQSSLRRSLLAHFGGRVEISGNTTGLYLVAKITGVFFDETLLARLVDNGVKVYPVKMNDDPAGLYSNKIMLGYGNLSEMEIEKGISLLKEVLSR